MTAYTISVAGLTLGAQGVNSISADFTNPAATVVQNTTWTPLNVKYLYADSSSKYTVRSVSGHDTRDVEVTTWVRQGYVFVRLDGTGKAIYFYHNGESANGTLQIGITTGLTESGYPSGTQYLLYENTDCVGTIAGYSKTDTTGDSFTFGVSGFDIYVKFDPGSGAVEFCRFKEYRHMEVGSVALKSSSPTYGFRDITHTTLATVTLASDYTNHEINMADWGMRSGITTGSISAGLTTLTVASATDFRVGDYIIVEIGTEAGLGARGTVGVGNIWPTNSYATTAALLAATPAVGTFAYAQDTGIVYEYFNPGGYPPPGTLGWYGSTQDVLWGDRYYYGYKALPRSLHTRITNIAGTTITLGTAATVTAANANVYIDNQLLFNDLLQQTRSGLSAIAWPNRTMTLTIPAGTYAIGGNIYAQADAGATGLTIKGVGQTSAYLVSPKGMRAARIAVSQWPSTLIKDFTLSGNYGPDKYGLAFYDTLVPSVVAPTQYGATGLITTVQDQGSVSNTEFSAAFFQSGGIVLTQCDNTIVQDVTVNDVFTNAVNFNTLDNGWAYRCTVTVNSLTQAYTQWQYEAATLVTNCGFQDCVFRSLGIHPGWEVFSGSTTQFIRPISINGVFSLNNAGGWLIKDGVITVTPGAGTSISAPDQGMVQITVNTGHDLVAPGGTISNLRITTNYINASNDIPVGILITDGGAGFLQNISIVDGYYHGPDYLAPSLLQGPSGIRSDAIASSITVNRFCSGGTVAPGGATYIRSNIGLTAGSVTDSFANSIVAPTITRTGVFLLCPYGDVLLPQACL